MMSQKETTLYKAIGTIQILFSASLLFVFLYYSPQVQGTVVVPELLRNLIIYALFLASGIGIVFQKKYLFLSSFVVYPILILRRVDWIYLHLRTEKIGEGIDHLYKAIIWNSLFQLIFAALFIYILMFLLHNKVLSKFSGVSKKITLINIVAGSIAYIMFFRL